MSGDPILSRLKLKYRSRYYGNRVQDTPNLNPGDNAVSFVNNYLNVTVSNSFCEDYGEENVTCSLPEKMKATQDFSLKSHVHATPQHSQGGGPLTRNSPAIRSTLKKYEKPPEISVDQLFSDEESDDEESHMVAKLIETSLTDHDDIVDHQVVNIAEKQREKLYSSDSSVVQGPPSPTSNIHAKKWLSFKDSTLAVNNSAPNKVSRTSEEFINKTRLKQQEVLNSTNENLHRADVTYDLHTASLDSREKNEFVVEKENGCSLDAWVSPVRKSKSSTRKSSPRTKEDKPTSSPKNNYANEVSSSLQKKCENVKASQISSTIDDDRSNDEFLIEEEQSCNLDLWVSPFKKKRDSPPSRKMEDKTRTPPSHMNSM